MGKGLTTVAVIFGLMSALTWHLSATAPTPELVSLHNQIAALLCVLGAACLFIGLFCNTDE